jgi:hydroxymethylpyrimidine/phosphomethylpyrimidine kinase
VKPAPRILAIAGSDSSGGAGIQADVKTITMLGGYAMTAITAITAQNTTGVAALEVLSPDMVGAQIDACVSDIGVDAVKIGMLGSPAIADAVADRLQGLGVPVVFDPVMVATSSAVLADPQTIESMRSRLMPLATLLTPNIPELEVLAGRDLDTLQQIGGAATALADQFGFHVLAKGGHSEGQTITDLLVGPGGLALKFEHERIDTQHTHGTGCTTSSAIATFLGAGLALDVAVKRGGAFVLEAIRLAPGFGSGGGPIGHQAVGRRR